MWRALVVIVGLAALGAGGYWLYTSQASQLPGEWVAVTRGDITATVSATGKVEPKEEVKLSFKIGGRLASVSAAEGQRLEEGQLVAELEPGTLRLAVDEAETSLALRRLKLQQARRGVRQEEKDEVRARVAAAQARLDNLRARPRPDEVAEAKAALDKAKVAVENAQTAYDRVSYAPNIGELAQARQLQLATVELQAAQAVYDRALRGATAEELREAEAEVAAAQARLDLAEHGPLSEDIAILEKEVELARLALERAKANLGDVQLTSPASGTVLTLPVRAGEYVAPQQVVATVGSLGALRIRADIDEVDVGKVAVGQEAAVSFDAFPGEKVKGKITEIFPEAKVKSGATVYEALLEFSTPLPIRPRMAADLDIRASHKEGVLLLPNRAVQTVGRKKVVEVLEGDRVIRRTVEVGLSDDTQSEITEGLQEGDLVLIR